MNQETIDRYVIQTNKGEQILISNEDSDLAQNTWCVGLPGYARNGHMFGPNKPGYIHKIVLERILGFKVPSWCVPDHINRNKLDNRRENIRPSTTSLNGMNKMKKLNVSSVYEGVSWEKRCRKWLAQIRIGGGPRFLGYFDREVEASYAYQTHKAQIFEQATRQLHIRLFNYQLENPNL